MSRAEQVRIFVGTAIPTDIGNHLNTELRKSIGDDKGWRSAPIEQLHITSFFIGNRDQSLLPSIQDRIARIASRTSPITVINGRLATMPKTDPYMCWVRFQPEPALTTLHHEIAKAMGAGGSAYTPYWPHITLARTRNTIANVVDDKIIVDRFTIDHLTLFRSILGPNGSQHRALQQWPLS